MLTACATHALQPPFTPPDGRWWLAASASARDGFTTGQDECDTSMLRHGGASMSIGAFEAAITDFYENHPKAEVLPVTSAINQLEQQWRRTRAYPIVTAPPPDKALDGGIWHESPADARDGIVRGFLACQTAEQAFHEQLPVSTLVDRVSTWYGTTLGTDDISGVTVNDKLFRVILRAEKPGPRQAPPTPDGHWWLAASIEARDGYLIGYNQCDGSMLRNRGPAMALTRFEAAITNFYATHPADAAWVVTDAINWLESGWERFPLSPWQRPRTH